MSEHLVAFPIELFHALQSAVDGVEDTVGDGYISPRLDEAVKRLRAVADTLRPSEVTNA